MGAGGCPLLTTRKHATQRNVMSELPLDADRVLFFLRPPRIPSGVDPQRVYFPRIIRSHGTGASLGKVGATTSAHRSDGDGAALGRAGLEIRARSGPNWFGSKPTPRETATMMSATCTTLSARAGLRGIVRTGATETKLTIFTHHAVADGLGVLFIVEDFSCFTRFSAGRRSSCQRSDRWTRREIVWRPVWRGGGGSCWEVRSAPCGASCWAGSAWSNYVEQEGLVVGANWRPGLARRRRRCGCERRLGRRAAH